MHCFTLANAKKLLFYKAFKNTILHYNQMFKAVIFSKSHKPTFQTSSAVCAQYIVISSSFSENNPQSDEKVNFGRFPDVTLLHSVQGRMVINVQWDAKETIGAQRWNMKRTFTDAKYFLHVTDTI